MQCDSPCLLWANSGHSPPFLSSHPNEIHERAQWCGYQAPPGIVEEWSGKPLPPRLENRLKRAAVKMGTQPVFEIIDDTRPCNCFVNREIGRRRYQRAAAQRDQPSSLFRCARTPTAASRRSGSDPVSTRDRGGHAGVLADRGGRDKQAPQQPRNAERGPIGTAIMSCSRRSS